MCEALRTLPAALLGAAHHGHLVHVLRLCCSLCLWRMRDFAAPDPFPEQHGSPRAPAGLPQFPGRCLGFHFCSFESLCLGRDHFFSEMVVGLFHICLRSAFPWLVPWSRLSPKVVFRGIWGSWGASVLLPVEAIRHERPGGCWARGQPSVPACSWELVCLQHLSFGCAWGQDPSFGDVNSLASACLSAPSSQHAFRAPRSLL